MKPGQFQRGIYVFGSGTIGNPTVKVPQKCALVGLDFGLGWMIGEAAPATSTSYCAVWLGSPLGAYTTNSEASNVVGAVSMRGRSNATFASHVPLLKSITGLWIPLTSRDFLTVDWTAAGNQTLEGWVTMTFFPV